MPPSSPLPFAHPVTHTPLVPSENGWLCTQTNDLFPLFHGIPTFIPQELKLQMEEERQSFVNRLKTFLRRFPRLYIALIYVISPICFVGVSAKSFVRTFPSHSILLNIGSGIHRLAPQIVNIDIFWYRGVDVIADAHALPFRNDSIDGIVCECLLEHVPDPQQVVREFLRVLKPNGRAYLAVPFVYPFHACPNDFFRWSKEGIRKLCEGATIDVIAPRSGPTTALVAILGTWAAIVCSFGNATLFEIFNALFTALFSPLKWLDVIFGRFPTAIYGAASWYAIIRKPDMHTADRPQASQ